MLNELDPQVKALLEQFQANAARHPAPATPLSQKEKIMATREMITVVIHGRDEARASAVAREIRDQGGRASVVLGDLSCDAGADGEIEVVAV